ncbi:response regulator [Agrobacterium sp.]|uniref:response regulator n=1 Tax=Agrobacterium sp. TaxID=361 RepID=UPI0028A67D4D|nr:response regulator [Agrobacterium sp.]
MACEGIRDLDLPACIKDSELRYVAVNEAYARFIGRPMQDFPAKGTYELSGNPGDIDREDKERRSLVFATEEIAACQGAVSLGRHAIRCERFIADDGAMFLYEVFETMPAFELEALGRNEAEILVGSGVLDLIDVGICIYSRENRLLYHNARLSDFYRMIDLELKPGMRLSEVLGSIYDHAANNGEEGVSRDPSARRAWLNDRLDKYNLPYFETTEQLCDRTWLRQVNKRLESGLLICLRVDVTEFKAHEVLLSRHIRETWLYREALEELPVPVFLRDSDRRLTFINAAYERLLGGDRRKFLGQTAEDMFPDMRAAFRREDEEVLTTGTALQKEESISFSNGAENVPVITRLGRIVTPDDERYLVGSITDVSVLKDRETRFIQAQQETEALHAELEGILKSLPVGVLLLGPDLIIEYANKSFYQTLDTRANIDLVGLTYRNFLEITFKEKIYDYSGKTFEEVYDNRIARLQSPDDFEPLEMRSASGRVTVISCTRIAGGKVLITYTDITGVRERDNEISLARAELARVGEYMQEATRAMAQGLLLIENGVVITSNDALPRMLDVPASFFAPGEGWLEIFAFCARRGDFGGPDGAAATFDAWHDNVAKARPFTWLFPMANNSWFNLEATISTAGYWVITITDVTEMKRREAELERLVQRAEAADRAKSEFLANMSHEIRTPMNGVLGMAELLAKSDLDTRQKTFTDVIVKSGNALLTIINDILDFSKIDAGQMKLRKVLFDPVEAVEDVASLLSSTASEKDIELAIRIDPSVQHMVVSDAGRFRQIITNLVGNAVKFTETGYVLIELAEQTLEAGEVLLTIRVQDTGIGIPSDKLASIFDKFSQVDSSTTRRHEGTGLGLAITVGLVGIFAGSINVESAVGEGTLFTVKLPLEAAALRGNKSTALPAADLSGARVLVIDDNEINRQILSEQLSQWGYDSYAAESGAAGLAIIEQAAELGVVIDTVILDYHMPGMNGIDVARQIRYDDRLQDMGIVFLTSMDMVVGDDSLLNDMNVQAHLMKPARAKLLRSTLGEIVRASRLQRRERLLTEQQYEAKQAACPSPSALKSELRKPVSKVVTPAVASTLDVLVAEDNDVNQIVFSQILQGTGLRFSIVNNGKKAVAAWEEHNPAVILMDVSMPVMNGHQATQLIREREAEAGDGRHVPIVGVTAHAQESDRERCLEVGMDDYVSKPISPELLEAKLKQWLGETVVQKAGSAL